MTQLSDDTFAQIIKNTPLIAIDFLVCNSDGKYLLGLRTNKPAQGYWFVPGGRIRKGETLETAFRRLTQAELGIELEMKAANFQGVYEHLYEDNVFNDLSYGTHYIVLGYHLNLDIDLTELPAEQHGTYKWFDKKELLDSDEVHGNTKAYFE